MYAQMLFAGAVIATSGAMAEPMIFHTVKYADNTAVSLSVMSNTQSSAPDFDYDISIGLTQLKDAGTSTYVDPGRHRVRVRCEAPALIVVRGASYPVGVGLNASDPKDWKEDLWRAVCTIPVS